MFKNEFTTSEISNDVKRLQNLISKDLRIRITSYSFIHKDNFNLLINSKEADLKTLLADFDEAEQHSQDTWLILILIHPNISAEQLYSLAKRFNLSDLFIAETIVLSGNSSLFRELLSIYKLSGTLDEILDYDNFLLFNRAAIYGYIGIVRHIVELRFSFWDSIAYYLPFIVSNTPFKRMINNQNQKIFIDLAENGQIEVFRFLKKWSFKSFKSLDIVAQYFIFYVAVSGNHLAFIEYLANKLKAETLELIIVSRDYAAYHAACDTGNVDLVKFLESKIDVEKKQDMIASSDYSALRNSLKYGRVRIVKHLLEEYPGVVKRKEVIESDLSLMLAAYTVLNEQVKQKKMVRVKIPPVKLSHALDNHGVFKQCNIPSCDAFEEHDKSLQI